MKKTTNPIQPIILAALAVLMPAALSAAPSKITIGFDTDGNNQGFAGTNVTGLATAGGFITGTGSTGDPRLIRNNATPFFTKPSAASWQTVVFRVRETDETPAVVTPYNSTGVIVGLNSANSTSGLVTATGGYPGVDSGDGFFTVTADISTFTADEVRYFRVDPIGGADAAGNLFEVDFIEINLTNTPPALVSTNPADDATGIAPAATLTATFDEPITLNTTGIVTIKNLTTLTDTVISLPGPDPDGVLSVDGNVLTIDPTAVLGAPGDEIAIEISADAIKDADDVFYAGILATDVPNWSFTIDNTPPTPIYFHPITGTSTTPLDGALFIAFDEAPQIGTGNIGIYRASDDSLVENIDVTSVTQNGNRIAITPTVALAYNTSYYVLIDSGAFADDLGNNYPGISDSSVWTFSTIADDPTVLFGDSFNRPNDADLNESVGKYGSLGALTYTPVIIGALENNIQLSDGQLLLETNGGDGTSGTLVYPNHNFTDAAIASAGGFSITVDLNTYISGGSRFMTVAMGQTSTDLDDQTSATPTGSKGDLAVAYRRTTTSGLPGLFIYKNGVLVSEESNTTDPLPQTPTKLRIDCTLTDFAVDSEVAYEVFFDDSETAFTSGTFTWSGTGENYISLASTLTLTNAVGERHCLFDNLQIRTLGSGGGSGFDTWKVTNGVIGGIDEDHDNDGVTNGVEYFIGGPNGNTTGFTALPGVVNDAGTLSVTFTKAADYAGSYGADFEVEVSTTLANWGPAPEGTVTFPSATEVKYTFPAGTRNFARLKVTGP
jgi:hypothetical protein